MSNKTKGTLFIIAAPSGAGKTSLVSELTSSMDNLRVSISHTTRSKRPGEQHGVNYYFVDQNEFEQMINDNKFLEHAKVFGYAYGTSKAAVLEQLEAGYDVILEIDWQGAQQVRQLMPEVVSIFIMPPSLASLKQRLVKRAQDDATTIARRLSEAEEEMSHRNEFDYIVVNEDFDTAFAELKQIISSH